jgi:hypothetical protein
MGLLLDSVEPLLERAYVAFITGKKNVFLAKTLGEVTQMLIQ